jgi:PAS domain S-box-containing protein
LSSGADDYIVKPFGARELLARVEGTLRLAKARREAAAAERQFVERTLVFTEERLSLALDSARMGMWDWDLLIDELTWSPTCKAIFGKPPDAPISYSLFLELVHPEDRTRVDVVCKQAVDPDVRAPFDIQFRVVWPDGNTHWIMARGKVYFAGDRSTRFTGTACDITEQKDAEAHLRVVIDELSHRVKNTLAVIQSIAEQTFKAGSDVDAIHDAFAGRLRALAETHTLLTRAKWESVDIAALVERSVGRLVDGDPRFDVAGPAAELTPKASLALGLVMHELATNAVKHGAWATDSGTVVLRWHLAEGELVLEWTETGIFGLTLPSRASFGTKLINQAIEYDLHGEVERNYRPDGICCRLSMPAGKALASAFTFSN